MQSGKEREPVVLAIFHKLGGRSVLGRDIASAADLARIVFLRIPLKSLEHLTRSGSFSDQEISDMVIPARTHRHRKQKQERLSVEESDRLVRLTRPTNTPQQHRVRPGEADSSKRKPMATSLYDLSVPTFLQTEGRGSCFTLEIPLPMAH
jgi:hypothetical protein